MSELNRDRIESAFEESVRQPPRHDKTHDRTTAGAPSEPQRGAESLVKDSLKQEIQASLEDEARGRPPRFDKHFDRSEVNGNEPEPQNIHGPTRHDKTFDKSYVKDEPEPQNIHGPTRHDKTFDKSYAKDEPQVK